ncbi:septum site-determining protein MinC [Chitinimonas arctica]|uniref:Probable septum site-determining protein MinC n=1 Tax=Chitinimonas arctica TaxID=2594795 RepID=A0A516SCF9_9NEIS|nr:septum site-determining protein MinC [Chitinimonas arctica]QDQ25843.1 septum site-determining protein MinC [Chitinimonas arctica]
MTASIKPAPARSTALFEIKSAALNLIAFAPKTADLAGLEAALSQKLGGRADFFGGDAVVLELADWPPHATALDLSGLISILRKSGLQAVAARGVGAAAREAVIRAGLALLPDTPLRDTAVDSRTCEAKPAPVAAVNQTLIIDKPVRSGQQVYARGGDLIVLALVSHGAEVIADGNIHVYAPLRGRALAGARGDTGVRIFTHCMQAELLSIAGIYRSLDEPLPQSIKAQAAQVRLDGNKLVIEALALD